MDSIINSQDHIKRPLNSFMVWAKERRRMMNRNNPKMRNAEISKILGEEWRQMPESEKRPYMEEALRLRRQHKADHPNYRYKPRRKQKQEQLARERSAFDRLTPFPRLHSAPVVTTNSLPSFSHGGGPSYMSSFFSPRFPPMERPPFSCELPGPKPVFPSSFIRPFYSPYCIPPPPHGERSPKDFNPLNMHPLSCRTDAMTRVAYSKDGAFPIPPAPLPSPSTSPGGHGGVPGVASAPDSKSPVPYLMLKAELQYM